jgi:hypothetical protein
MAIKFSVTSMVTNRTEIMVVASGLDILPAEKLGMSTVAAKIAQFIEEGDLPVDAWEESVHVHCDTSLPISFYRDLLEEVAGLPVDI